MKKSRQYNYEYTDRVIRIAIKRFVRMFSSARLKLLKMDELNILEYSKEFYSDLNEWALLYLGRIAHRAYKQTAPEGEKTKRKPSKAWLLLLLAAYDPVTRYVYVKEVDRKRARFAESVIASHADKSAVDTALRYWTTQFRQTAITATDKAAIEGYKDAGVKRVRWVAVEDSRTCTVCRERDGNIYDIDAVPPKEHYNCRCVLEPVTEGGRDAERG